MSYHVNPQTITLTTLTTRINQTDLTPGLVPVRDQWPVQVKLLQKAGIRTLADLRTRLKTKKTLAVFAAEADMNPDYLVLLRRMVEGFFPDPRPLAEFSWLDSAVIQKLKQAGIADTRQLFEAGKSELGKTELMPHQLMEAQALADLCRIQWVSPLFARSILAAGLNSAAAVAKSDPEKLCAAVAAVNGREGFFKGKIGVRDIRRLVFAAAQVL